MYSVLLNLPAPQILALIVFGVFMLHSIAIIHWLLRYYRKVEPGKALIINKTNGLVDVSFTGGLVLPIIHQADVIDLTLKTIDIVRRGNEGLICADDVRADIKMTFFVRVNNTQEAIISVAQSVGCARASDPKMLGELFQSKFSEAMKTAAQQMKFADLNQERIRFKQKVVELIGSDLNGYILDDAAIDHLERTPLDSNGNAVLAAAAQPAPLTK